MTTKGKIITWTVAVLLIAATVFCYFKFFFVFGEGVKAGELNLGLRPLFASLRLDLRHLIERRDQRLIGVL